MVVLWDTADEGAAVDVEMQVPKASRKMTCASGRRVVDQAAAELSRVTSGDIVDFIAEDVERELMDGFEGIEDQGQGLQAEKAETSD